MPKCVLITPENIKQIDSDFNQFKKDYLDGGYIEQITIRPGLAVYMDEDGKAKRLPINQIATEKVLELLLQNGRSLFGDDYLVGNVLVIAQDQGEECDLPDEIIEWLVS